MYRYTDNIDIDRTYLVESELINKPIADLSQSCEQSHITLKYLLDKHVPVRSKSVKFNHLHLRCPLLLLSTPLLFRMDIKKITPSYTQLNRSTHTKESHFCDKLIHKAKSDFYRNTISNNNGNPHQLRNCIYSTLHRNASVSLPAHDSTNSPRNSFPRYFKDKITKIHTSFQSHVSSYNVDFSAVHHRCTVFKSATLTEIAKLILSPANKPCELDTIATFLLNSCLHKLIVPITKILN